MNALANISVADAKLPAAYEAAKVALATCMSIDECQNWANKAEALASYAKQADDDTLRKQADRIQARAIRRCGELLKQFDGRGRPSINSIGDGTISQREAAEQAGLSKRQQVTAVRVAKVPEHQFEAAVESDQPPTVTRLSEMAPKPPPKPLVNLRGRDPREFNRALHFIAEVTEYANAIERADLTTLLPSLLPSECEKLRSLIGRVDTVHDHIITRI